MSLIWSGLAPHPPVIVEAVGGIRSKEAQLTIDWMRAFAVDFMAAHPRRLILVSPHTPRPTSGVACWLQNEIHGTFTQFGAPNTTLSLPVDTHWMRQFQNEFWACSDLGPEPLDHGAMVPLHFLMEAGWDGPTGIIGLPWAEDTGLESIGDLIQKLCQDDVPTALIASGDMSHCLKPGAPCEYDPRGKRFDDSLVAHLKQGFYRAASQTNWELQSAAKQDVMASCRIVWQALNYRNDHFRFYGYEGPFGVGYTVMKFFGESP